MQLLEAKAFIGKLCAITWQDRSGEERHIVSKVHDAAFVPMYGGYLVTDIDDIRLDRVIHVALVDNTPQTLAALAREYDETLPMAA